MRTLVLLHGLGRTKWSLWPVAREARRRGRTVHNLGYPSRSAPIEALAEDVGHHLENVASSGEPVDVVTHSMGGIVLRAAVASGIVSPESLHRVVMLAPPNHGSELADRLRDFTIYRFALGPAGQQIGTGEHSVPLRLPPAPFEVGVIAGRRSNMLFARMLGAESDGKVTVESARLEGMRDLVVVDRAHTFIMWAPDVLEHIFSFLATGRFSQASS